MAKKKASSTANTKSVTPERAIRLYRLIALLGKAPLTRAALSKKLGLDVRGFYRDLELLRSSGIEIVLQDEKYQLLGDPSALLARLPLPDPHLTLGEAEQLAKGKTKVHNKLLEQVRAIQS